MLDLRNAKPNFFYPVFCRLEKDTPIASYEIPSNLETLRKDSRAIKGFGNRFFWSHATETFVIQIAQTFEYSEKSESEQIFLAGESFGTVKVLSKEDLLFLPSSEYKEVFPEMHPDRSRSD